VLNAGTEQRGAGGMDEADSSGASARVPQLWDRLPGTQSVPASGS